MNQSTFYEARPGYAGEITPSASRQAVEALDSLRNTLEAEEETDPGA